MTIERKPVAFGDLRGWIKALKAAGEVKEVSGEVDWNIELGTLMRMAQGAGDGPAAAAMRTRPPDLRRLAKSNDGVFPDKVLATVIDGRKTIRAHGTFEMPVWGRQLSQSVGDGDASKRIAAIVAYLRSIQLK